MFAKLKGFFSRKNPIPFAVNYLYFSLAFVYISALSFINIFSKEAGGFFSKLYFLFTAAGQSLLEIACIVLIASWIWNKLPSWIYKLFIGISFFALSCHLVDFILVRLMDASFMYAFNLLFAEGITHFFAAFAAMNLSHTMLIMMAALLVIIPLIGIAIYFLTKKVIRKKALILRPLHLLIAVFALSVSLIAIDISAKPFLDAGIYSQYSKSLPFGASFVSPSGPKISLPGAVKHPRNEDEVLKKIGERHFTAEKKPNIYLFVVETFRADYVTPEIAPNLYQFKKENFSFPLSLSNASSTHISWFSIFHSVFPHHWTEMKKNWKGGSATLHILKDLGYRINVFSTAELSYYKMNDLLFGEQNKMLDVYQEFPSCWDQQSCDRDKSAMQALQNALSEENGSQGNLFVVFLDSTHSEYSWPKDFPTKFTPISDGIDYLSMAGGKKDLQLVKNRYKNSVAFVDHLFGEFMKTLKEKQLDEEAIVVVTGDHGEEFFEHGAMFHGTHINQMQTSVPLYYKFGQKQNTSTSTFTSHMDIFPSILHHLTGQDNFADLFDGESLFKANRWPYIFTVKQNAGKTPYEFFIHDGRHKILAKFVDPKDIYSSEEIEILAMENAAEERLSQGKDPALIEEFQSAFDQLTVHEK